MPWSTALRTRWVSTSRALSPMPVSTRTRSPSMRRRTRLCWARAASRTVRAWERKNVDDRDHSGVDDPVLQLDQQPLALLVQLHAGRGRRRARSISPRPSAPGRPGPARPGRAADRSWPSRCAAPGPTSASGRDRHRRPASPKRRPAPPRPRRPAGCSTFRSPATQAASSSLDAPVRAASSGSPARSDASIPRRASTARSSSVTELVVIDGSGGSGPRPAGLRGYARISRSRRAPGSTRFPSRCARRGTSRRRSAACRGAPRAPAPQSRDEPVLLGIREEEPHQRRAIDVHGARECIGGSTEKLEICRDALNSAARPSDARSGPVNPPGT